MYKYHCLNPIAACGLEQFDGNYEKTENVNEADAIMSGAQPCMIWSSPTSCPVSQEPAPV